MTGNEMLERIKDLVDEYSNEAGPEQNRALRSLNAAREAMTAEIWSLGENYLLTSATFSATTTAPNSYTISTVNSNAFADFGKLRMLERVISDANSDYERIYPLPDIARKYDLVANYDHIISMLTSSTSKGKPKFYALGADTLFLFPVPDSAYTIRLWYQKVLADIAATTTELVDIPEALQSVMVMDAAIEEKVRRNLPISELARMRDQRLQVALANLHSRVSDGPVLMNFTDFHYV